MVEENRFNEEEKFDGLKEEAEVVNAPEPNANEHVNKVILGSQVLIDLTGDDVTAADVASGKKFHLPSGASATGTNTKDADTQDATATASEILNTKTAYVKGSKVTGSMPNNGAVSLTIATKDAEPAIVAGYHDGSGKAALDATEKAKLIPDNIKQGITMFGVVGSHSGTEDVKATACNVTPTLADQQILPGDLGDYNYISQVNVAKVPRTDVDNEQGGVTVTICPTV